MADVRSGPGADSRCLQTGAHPPHFCNAECNAAPASFQNIQWWKDLRSDRLVQRTKTVSLIESGPALPCKGEPPAGNGAGPRSIGAVPPRFRSDCPGMDPKCTRKFK